MENPGNLSFRFAVNMGTASYGSALSAPRKFLLKIYRRVKHDFNSKILQSKTDPGAEPYSKERWECGKNIDFVSLYYDRKFFNFYFSNYSLQMRIFWQENTIGMWDIKDNFVIINIL